MGGPLCVISRRASRGCEAGDHIARDLHADQHWPPAADTGDGLGVGGFDVDAAGRVRQRDVALQGRSPVHIDRPGALGLQAVMEAAQPDVDRA